MVIKNVVVVSDDIEKRRIGMAYLRNKSRVGLRCSSVRFFEAIQSSSYDAVYLLSDSEADYEEVKRSYQGPVIVVHDAAFAMWRRQNNLGDL